MLEGFAFGYEIFPVFFIRSLYFSPVLFNGIILLRHTKFPSVCLIHFWTESPLYYSLLSVHMSMPQYFNYNSFLKCFHAWISSFLMVDFTLSVWSVYLHVCVCTECAPINIEVEPGLAHLEWEPEAAVSWSWELHPCPLREHVPNHWTTSPSWVCFLLLRFQGNRLPMHTYLFILTLISTCSVSDQTGYKLTYWNLCFTNAESFYWWI